MRRGGAAVGRVVDRRRGGAGIVRRVRRRGCSCNNVCLRISRLRSCRIDRISRATLVAAILSVDCANCVAYRTLQGVRGYVVVAVLTSLSCKCSYTITNNRTATGSRKMA